MGQRQITVGQAARRAGISPKAVRLYETRGILPPAERTEAGYRTYTQHDVEILRFVRRARALGLHLEEIRRIVDLERHGAQPCRTVMELLERHLREIDRTMTDLRALRKDLVRTLDAAKSSVRRGSSSARSSNRSRIRNGRKSRTAGPGEMGADDPAPRGRR